MREKLIYTFSVKGFFKTKKIIALKIISSYGISLYQKYDKGRQISMHFFVLDQIVFCRYLLTFCVLKHRYPHKNFQYHSFLGTQTS